MPYFKKPDIYSIVNRLAKYSYNSWVVYYRALLYLNVLIKKARQIRECNYTQKFISNSQGFKKEKKKYKGYEKGTITFLQRGVVDYECYLPENKNL